MENFFDVISSDQPFNLDYTFGGDSSDVGVGWDELPPAFMGTQTSFGQQPQAASMNSHGLQSTNYFSNAHMINSRPLPPTPTTASSRILGATSFLENSSDARIQRMSNEVLYRSPSMHVPQPPTNGHGRHSMNFASPRPTNHEEPEFKDTFYTDMVFGSQDTFRPRQVSQNHAKVDLRWGSDSGFGVPEGFVPPINQQKEVVALEHSHIKAIAGAFIETSSIPSSANSTRVSSPNQPRISIPHQRTKSIAQSHEDEDYDSRSRKRKSKYQGDDEEDQESPLSATYKSKKRKPIKKMDSPTESSEQGHKRRKSSAAAAAKATRENLTEDQKRENHIKSEQKRRTLIREGFEDLGELVPGLRGGGFSKSAVLIMSADWLEDLLHGNEMLRQRLDHMHGR